MFLQHKTILNILIILNLSIISIAYFIEYILNIPPCTLCIYQRVPYYFAIVILIFTLLGKIKLKKLMIILIFLSIISLSLSFYHIGIERGFFSELATCKNNIITDNTQNLLKELQKQKIVPCKEISFTIFGLSLATINFIVSFTLILLYWGIFKYEK